MGCLVGAAALGVALNDRPVADGAIALGAGALAFAFAPRELRARVLPALLVAAGLGVVAVAYRLRFL